MRAAGWWARLAPDAPRRIPYGRWLNISLRTVHLAAFAVLLGGHAWEVEGERLVAALVATIVSGLGLVGLELIQTARWLVEVRGLLVLAKLGLLLLVPAAWDHRVAILIAVVVIASVGSHMPARLRHASLEARAPRAASGLPHGGRARP